MGINMMETVRMWHTPYIGAYLLWRFASGYNSASNGRGVPLLLFFIVSALVTDKKYYDPVLKRNLVAGQSKCNCGQVKCNVV